MNARERHNPGPWLRKWHRRAGLLLALILILITLTGIVLNHTGRLGLDQRYPQSSWLLRPYAALLPKPQGFEVDARWLWSDGRHLRLDRRVLFDCARLLGLARMRRQGLVRCESGWLHVDQDWRLLHQLDPGRLGLFPTRQVLANEQGFWLRRGGQWMQLDPAQERLTAAEPEIEPHPDAFQALPREFGRRHNHLIHWRRVLLDLHTGVWFGGWGIWMVDLAALGLLFLILSGLWIWCQGRR